jgi:hypothetical protein
MARNTVLRVSKARITALFSPGEKNLSPTVRACWPRVAKSEVQLGRTGEFVLVTFL